MRSKNRKEIKNYLINLAKATKFHLIFSFLQIIDFYQIKWADELFIIDFPFVGFAIQKKNKKKI